MYEHNKQIAHGLAAARDAGRGEGNGLCAREIAPRKYISLDVHSMCSVRSLQ